MEPNYVQGLCASIGLLKCSEGENLNPKKKKKENNESCFVSLFSKFNFDVGLLGMHGKTGIIWIRGNMVFTAPIVINISTIC